MSFSGDEFMTEYLTNGFYCFNAKEILSQVCLNVFSEIDKSYPDLIVPENGFEFNLDEIVNSFPISQDRKSILDLQVVISNKILKDFSHILKFDVLSYHVCKDVQAWHNDAELSFEGQNASINCFFDDMGEDVGGAFIMQPYSDNPGNEFLNISSVYPKKYDVIILNQNRNWLHRVQPSTKFRRLVSYACRFDDFNPIVKGFF